MDQRTADRVLSELAHLREMFSSKSKKALKMPDGIQVSFKVARSAGEKNGAIGLFDFSFKKLLLKTR